MWKMDQTAVLSGILANQRKNNVRSPMAQHG
jgi:hypothetical protein